MGSFSRSARRAALRERGSHISKRKAMKLLRSEQQQKKIQEIMDQLAATMEMKEAKQDE